MENRAENNEISQEQHSNELDCEQRTVHTPTTSKILPKEQPLENTESQAGEIPPKEQRLGNIGPQPGEISPEEQGLEDTGAQSGEIPPKQQNGDLNSPLPRIGEIPQQKVHQLNAKETTTTEEGESTQPNREVEQRESPRMDTTEHYLVQVPVMSPLTAQLRSQTLRHCTPSQLHNNAAALTSSLHHHHYIRSCQTPLSMLLKLMPNC